MKLISRSLRSRAFLLQFIQIIQEFGDLIPWLFDLKGLEYSTNQNYFFDQVLLRLSLDIEEIKPYQYIGEDPMQEYIGGIIYFNRSPECFKDFRNTEIQNRLIYEGYSYVSCLQVRNIHQSIGYGSQIMIESLKLAMNELGNIFGVVSDINILKWHFSLGATLESPFLNDDNLWIISWKC